MNRDKTTDTNQDELFSLCKKVYKRTGWKQEPDISFLYKYWDNYDELCVISIEEADDTLIPAYTSDYLLEKLPNGQRVVKVDEAYYVANNVQGLTDVNSDGESALVALLKFTLFLDKEGLL